MAAPSSLKDSGLIPEKGKWYALLSDYGDGVGMLTRVYHYISLAGEEYPGSTRQFYVLDVVDPATAGVGYTTEETVLCMWVDSPSPGRVIPHHLSFPMSQFQEMVTEGEEPPDFADLRAQQAGV